MCLYIKVERQTERECVDVSAYKGGEIEKVFRCVAMSAHLTRRALSLAMRCI
jgi:hypothetical protein